MFIMRVFFSIFVCTYCIYTASGRYVIPGKCPDLPGVENVDLNKLTGTWYVLKHIANDFDNGITCNKAKLRKNGPNLVGEHTAFNTTYGQVQKLGVRLEPTEKKDTYISTLTVFDVPLKFHAKILDVDYNKYFFLWGCVEIQSNSIHCAWLYFRNTEVDDETDRRISAVMDKFNFDRDQLTIVENSNCPSYY